MYSSQLFTTVNHLHATFGSGLNKRLPHFIHGADDVGSASSSDPSNGKVDSWGTTDPPRFLQFAERFPGDAQWGLGPGEIVGVPNVMDVSQPYGMIYGEGSPGGLLYHRAADEQTGRFLGYASEQSVPEAGKPRIDSASESVTAIWIAKSPTIPSMTNGMVGILRGSSLGLVVAYSLGSNDAHEHRFHRGTITAQWVLSPGVPIIAIAVDESHCLKRQAQNRIWAVVLNALGEVYYLTKSPHVLARSWQAKQLGQDGFARMAWEAGRSVCWNLVEPSRRSARPDPYSVNQLDGSYSPRSSWNGMCLSKEQIKAETIEIEGFLGKPPKEFQRSCLGWDMRRKLEVDFGGDDGHYAGENIIVVDCGLDEDSIASIHHYTRCRFSERRFTSNDTITASGGTLPDPALPCSLFGSTSMLSDSSPLHTKTLQEGGGLHRYRARVLEAALEASRKSGVARV